MSDTQSRAEQLVADGDMRIQVVKREINQGALAGLGSEISDYAAALVLVALDSYDAHLVAELGRCLKHDVFGYYHPDCGFHWHGKTNTDVPTRDGEPVCPRCQPHFAAIDRAQQPVIEREREGRADERAKLAAELRSLADDPDVLRGWLTAHELPGGLYAENTVLVLNAVAGDIGSRLGGYPGAPEPASEPDRKPCAACRCPLDDHHKLRCESCGECDGWRCPEHKLTLCGCTYAGGPTPGGTDG